VAIKKTKMNRILLLIFIAITLAGCQNQTNRKDSNSDKIELKPVNEKVFIELGGNKQYVEITGASDKDPILLFLHGGPGWPQTPHLRYFNSELTKEMILVSWDQAGCGKSYMQYPKPQNISLEQFVKDAHELTQILKEKFGKKKIYLTGFSWGSILGLKLIEKYPNDYEAYIGISQVINTEKSIELSLQWIKEQAQTKGDTEVLEKITRLENKDTSFCKTRLDCFMEKYQLLTKYNGSVHKKEIAKEIEKAEGYYDDYKEYDWFNAFIFSATTMEDDIFSTDLTGITQLEIPVYFLMGRHDWNLPTIVTENFVKNLYAPKKEIIWFENSGHEPLEEEANKFNETIIKIVKNKSY